VTSSYPELTAAIRFLPQSLILDGEILAWKDGRALNFTVLQQRLARKKLTDVYLREIPVVFMAYDILYRNGELLLDRTLEQRRALLEETFAGRQTPLLLSPQQLLGSLDAIDQRFAEARERGNEGLLLKRAGSVYEPGRRTGQWVKVKRPYATLDVVITAAEQGHGRRATMLSDYTFAVRAGDRYLNIGKAYSGLTDDEIRELTRLLRAAATERYGRVTLVRPEVVLEVAFDGIQKSPRHKSGFALRFPRILRWRKDKRPDQVDDLDRVVQLYESSLV
jgi:DNA ligase-1